MSSVWVALFLIGGAVLVRTARREIDGRLVAAVLVGFAGVALMLKPTMTAEQARPGFTGLPSGVLPAIGLLAAAGQRMMTLAYSHGATLGIAALQCLGVAFVFGVWLFDDLVTAGAVAGMVLIVGAGIVATLLRARTQPDTSPAGEG